MLRARRSAARRNSNRARRWRAHSIRPAIDILESRTLLSGVTWTGAGDGTNWTDAANWSDNKVPSSSDDVTIRLASHPTIQIASGSQSVHSVQSTDPIAISGGSLKVDASSALSGGLTMTGGLLEATGNDVSFTVTGTTSVSAANLEAEGGATLSLPQLTSYTPSSFTTTFSADGAGSVLNVSALTRTGIEGGGGEFAGIIDAINGGTINLSGLTSLGNSSQGLIILNDTGNSSLLDSDLTTLDGVDVGLDGTDTQGASSYTALTDGTLSVTGGNLTLPNLSDLAGSSLDLSGGTLTLSGLTNLDDATVVVSGGVTLDLPGGTSETGTTTLEATGAGSTLTLANTSLVEPTIAGQVLLVEALAGGNVSMPALTAISGGPVVLESDGANSVIDLAGLQTFTSTGGANASNGGSVQSSITLPAAPDVWINAGSGSWHTGSNWVFGVAPVAGTNVIINTAATATITLVSGDKISVNSVTLGASDTLSISAGAELATSSDFANGGSLTLAPGSQLTVGGNETETSSATLNEQIGGTPASGDFGQLAVTGTLTLAGTFDLALLDGFIPTVGEDFPVITFASAGGSFSTVTGLGSLAETLKPTSLDLVPDLTPPMFTADTPTTATVGSSYSYQFQASGTAPITFSATGLPAWAQFDPSTGILSGTPAAPGTFDVTVTASNGIAPDATADVSLIAQYEPPTFTADTPTVAVGGSPYSYQFQAIGTGTQPITYSATGLPGWAQLNPSTGLLSGTPTVDGTFDFSVTASDGIAPNATVNVSLLVAGGTAVTFNVPAGTTFAVTSGDYAGGTTFNVGAGATVTIDAGTFTGGAIFNLGTGAVVSIIDSPSFSGTLTGSGDGSVQVGGGRLYVVAGGLTLDFAGSIFQWTSGQIYLGNGNLTNLGTMTITNPVDFYNDGILDNFGTIIQTGGGNLQLGTDGTYPTTLMNEAGAYYLLEGDGGLSELSDSGSAPGQTSLDNEGIIRKTAGTGTSDFSVLGSITSTGTIEADSGTISLDPTLGISQLAGSTLTGGTWSAQDGAALQFPTGTNITTNAGNLVLGSGAAITGIDGLSSNSGSLTLTGGANFTTAGNFTNSGTLTVGAGSTLSVTGNETETAAGTLNVQIGGTPASGQFGQAAVTGAAELGGDFDVALENGTTPARNAVYPVMTFASASGSFAAVTGLGQYLTEQLTPASLDLETGTGTPVDLELSQASAPTTAATGQQITMQWQVSNAGATAASGNWQDSVYLSTTPAITSSSALLGSVVHTGGLSAGSSYNGTLTAAIPALAPGDYYVLVQADSLDQALVTNRADDTLAATTDQLAVSVPALTPSTPASGSFTGADQNQYYQITVPAGGSLVITLASAASSGATALYVAQGVLPTPYNYSSFAATKGFGERELRLAA